MRVNSREFESYEECLDAEKMHVEKGLLTSKKYLYGINKPFLPKPSINTVKYIYY